MNVRTALLPLLLLAACTTDRSTIAGTTTVPDTTVPATTVPATSVPDTTVPATTVPATTTAAPATTVPPEDVVVRPGVPAVGTSNDASLVTPDGRTRTYHVYVPSQLDQGVPAPLLLAFHGGTGWGKQFERNSGFDDLAEANGFIVVYPDGVGSGADEATNRTWNGGDCCGAAARNDVDDVGFVRLLLDTLEQQYVIDPARVYAAGHSNGGILSYRLACELSDRIVAAGLQSGTLEIASCTPSHPVSLLHIHGTADSNLPIDGGHGPNSIAGIDFVSPRVAVATFATADGCATSPNVVGDPANVDVTVATWRGCNGSSVVRWVEVAGATHPWMGHVPSNPSAPPAYQGLDSSLTIVRFLLQHPRTAG